MGRALAHFPVAPPAPNFFRSSASRPRPPGGNEQGAVIGLAQGSITALGTLFVAAHALAVLGLAALEYVGLRKARAAA